MNNKLKTIPMKYIGDIKVTISGLGTVTPGQTIDVPANMANNLVRDRNWEKVSGGATENSESAAPVETTETVEPVQETEPDEPKKKNKRNKEEL